MAGYEADDVLAAIATRWTSLVKLPVTVLSTDKDLTALIPHGVRVRDHFKDEDRGDAWVKNKFGVSASQLHDLLAVKTAAKWLGAHGTLDAVLRAASCAGKRPGDERHHRKAAGIAARQRGHRAPGARARRVQDGHLSQIDLEWHSLLCASDPAPMVGGAQPLSWFP